MIRTVSPADMRDMEQAFLQQTGTPGLLLMEHAAIAATKVLQDMAPANGRVLFVCGGGNNGGDGLAMARLWARSGGEAVVWLLVDPQSLPPDARANWQALLAYEPQAEVLTEARPVPQDVCVIVDAIFGTGLLRKVEGLFSEVIDSVGSAMKPVLSVDIPSGLDGLSGKILGNNITATRTVSFHRPKTGLYLYPARALCGEITIADIGIPSRWDTAPGYSILRESDIPGMMPRRHLFAHKGDSGHLLAITGSLGMAGAAAFSAQAACASGAGLVTIACPKSILPTVQALAPNAMATGLPESDGMLDARAAQPIEALLTGKDALAVGPGLGRAEGVAKALAPALQSSLPKVVDADALFALGDKPPPLRNAVLTPHPGEMSRMTGIFTGKIVRNAIQTARDFVRGRGEVLLLKGATTVIARDGETALNTAGHPALATGGSGDVLTGIIGALLAYGESPWKAARLGALTHGLAGERSARECGTLATSPQSIIQALGEIWRDTSL